VRTELSSYGFVESWKGNEKPSAIDVGLKAGMWLGEEGT